MIVAIMKVKLIKLTKEHEKQLGEMIYDISFLNSLF